MCRPSYLWHKLHLKPKPSTVVCLVSKILGLTSECGVVVLHFWYQFQY